MTDISSSTRMAVCVICTKEISDGDSFSKLHVKGTKGVNEASEKRGSQVTASLGDFVHKECRKNFCNPNLIKKDVVVDDEGKKATGILRSQEPNFEFSPNCLFCGQIAKFKQRKRGFDVYQGRTQDFHDTIMYMCSVRKDDWAEKVKGRLEFASDLHAVDAVYHKNCDINFRTERGIPAEHQDGAPCSSSKQKCGRPVNSSQNEAFQTVIKYLEESSDEQVTIHDLVRLMGSHTEGDAYSAVYMKKKLIEHFGETLIISELNGKSNVVTFRNTASSILHDFYQLPKVDDVNTEKLRIINTAAKLLKSDIKGMSYSKFEYQPADKVASMEDNLSHVPESLQLLLTSLFSERDSSLKIAAIGQAIVQASRPRSVLCPLQVGLGVQLHHNFGSKFLIDTLNSLGFSSSYTEVKQFELSAAASQGTHIPGMTDGHFIQFMADNVDHNVRTIDGHNTFHGMGIIAGITPPATSSRTVPRISATKEDLLAIGKINIHFYQSKQNAMTTLMYEKLGSIGTEDTTSKLDLFSKLSWTFGLNTPSWSGMMQMLQTGPYPGQSSFHFLPMIDLNPSDMSCIFSTLKFVSSQARRYETKAILTFDQPLFWKATTIVENEDDKSELKSTILRLGGFHTEMSFLGSIGHVMNSSGLSELLELVYAPNAVGHMMTGKSVARAVRGHFLVDRALNSLICSRTINIDENQQEDITANADLNNNSVLDQSDEHSATDYVTKLKNLYENLENKSVSVPAVCEDEVLQEIDIMLSTTKKSVQKFPTARLWLLYMEMIDILRRFIKAERTGNWSLHLTSLQEMLPYLAATGHNLYVKSAHIYLQKMQNLQTEHPDVYSYFTDGHHVLRRSDRYWAGLSTDLVIEQVLMRSVKTTGGLTRGRGMSESQQTQWLLSRPACAEINNAMQQITNTEFSTSEQHKEATQARKLRDEKDISTFISFLKERDPFSEDTTLRNIANGVTADSKTNVQNSKDIGEQILSSMISQNVLTYTFKRKNQVVTMGSKVSLKVNDASVHVDSQLLFQRLVTTAQGLDDNMQDLFKYELSTFPSSLFDQYGLPREANKPALADALWNYAGSDDVDAVPDENVQYVLDGGSLIHRIPWESKSTFSEICARYVEFVTRRYQRPLVVFDGYLDGPSTKDIAHDRRSAGKIGPEVKFTETMKLTSKKETFLSNPTNKQKFITMLSKKLEEHDCTTHHATGDADLLIVQMAVSCSKDNVTVLIGEDTDLLVLLCFHADMTSKDLYFTSEAKVTATKKVRVWDIKRVTQKLEPELCHALPFLHAITGCDATSRVFGIGKGLAFRKLVNENKIREQAKIFLTPHTSPEKVVKAGEIALCCLYGEMKDENLDLLRHKKFCNKVSSSSVYVQAHVLPPTSAAASHHSLRSYLQVQQWIGDGTQIDSQKWGWTVDKERNKLMPIPTHLKPAPEHLLKVVKCNCKTDCDSRRCSCKRHGLPCSVACGDCHGLNCSNSQMLTPCDTYTEE